MNDDLYTRDSCWHNGWSSDRVCRNGGHWNHWGRWVALAVIVGAAILIFFMLACVNARRRRRRGLVPYTGTHWMAPPPGPPPANQPYWGEPNYNSNNNNPNQPPPGYTPPHPQSYGYFGGQQPGGFELQQPPHTYQAAGEPYMPPPGPPPGKA